MPSGANASETAPLPEEANDQRYRELIRSQERLKLLLEITNRVVSKLDLPDLLREISANIRRVLDCNVVGVRLPDRETGELVMTGIDSKSEVPPNLTTSLVKRSTESVFRTRKIARLASKDIAAEPGIAAAGTKSLCGFRL
jgi:formate hydrogenlyase transcriptional activator